MADPKRIYELTGTSFDTDLKLAVDKSSFPNTKYINWSSFTFDSTVEISDFSNSFNVITPKSLLSTTATTTRKGIIEIATEAEAIAGTDTTKAVPSAYLGSIVESKFEPVKQYTLADLSSAGACTVVALQEWYEYSIGSLVFGNGTMIFSVPADTKKINITMNSLNLPASIQAGSGYSEGAQTSIKEPVAIDIATFSSKLLIGFTKSGNGINFAQSEVLYTIAFSYNFKKS